MGHNLREECCQRHKGLSAAAAILLAVFCFASQSGCKSSQTAELAGMLERKTLELSAPISEIIAAIPVEENQRVEEGQVIVQLDTEVLTAELDAQEASYAASQALLTEAQGEYVRTENLRKAKVASPQTLDAARRKRDEAVAQVAERKARVIQAKRRLNDLTIRSYAAGVVDQLPFEVGERVPAGGVVSVIIAEEKPWVRVWMPSSLAARAKSELEASVQIQGMDTWYKGTVEFISREPEFTPHYALTERESIHLVYESRIRLEDAPDDLRPGLPAQVRIKIRESD